MVLQYQLFYQVLLVLRSTSWFYFLLVRVLSLVPPASTSTGCSYCR